MSESEVNPNCQNSNSDLSMIEWLENESYLKRSYDETCRTEVQTKIEEFSNWLSGTARLCSLRCHPADSEALVYVLLNLEKKLRFTRSEVSRSVSTSRHTFTCNVCGETVEIQPWQNFWTTLQNHPHFEETYSQLRDFGHSNASDNFETCNSSTNDSIVDDLSEDLSHLELNQVTQTEPEEFTNGLDDFKFNFVVKYDPRIEEFLYPDSLTIVSRRKDNVAENTIQRCGVGRGVCLLCPCNLISKGRGHKITPFVVRSHVSGQRHLKCATSDINVSTLKKYHEFWKSQDPNYQAHQVHFIPEVYTLSNLRCQLCQVILNFDDVVAHINSSLHMKKLLTIFQTPEGKLNEFYLLDMQLQIYGAAANIPEESPKETAMETKTPKNNGSPSSKCVFVKFVVDPNNLSLPYRYKEHLRFLKKTSEGSVSCTACKATFDDNLAKIKGHIMSSQHRQISGLTVAKYTHFCEICHAYFKDEAVWDDHFLKGPNRHNSMSKVRQQKVAEYDCKTCKAVIYGDEMSLSRHISRSGKQGRAREIKLPIAVTKLFRTTKYIGERGLELQILATQVADQQDKIKECLETLEEALSVMYPSCRAYPFGSRISGLGNEHSDLDVFMDTGNMYLGEENQDSQSQEQFVKKASKLLKSKFKDFSHVLPIPSARTPIIRVRQNQTDLDCDVSFRHGLGVENTKFLRFCIELQPITQSLILLLKKWSKCCELNENLTNYGLALMAVFYLQTKGHLLPVKTIRAYNPSQSLVIDGWETLNYTVPVEEMRNYVTPYTGSLKQLLRDFFEYFSKFDYAVMVVCPLLGNTLPKLLFYDKPHEKLPPEMDSYIHKIQSENAEEFRGLSPFCIQDPFDLSHNLTKACQYGTITKLKAFCTLTCEFLGTIE